MSTLIEKTRNIIAAEQDDFFEDSTILAHLNNALEYVVSIGLLKERTQTNSIRALDTYRKITTLPVTNKTQKKEYFLGETTKPNVLEFQQVLSDTVPLKELTSNKLTSLNYGAAKVTPYEKYYNVETNKILIYTDGTLNENITYYYIEPPVKLLSTDTQITGSMNKLESAILYYAAHRLIMQETVRENQTNSFKSEALEQIEINLY
jgi:hypothetical protein